jgi:hypothetical protein
MFEKVGFRVKNMVFLFDGVFWFDELISVFCECVEGMRSFRFAAATRFPWGVR